MVKLKSFFDFIQYRILIKSGSSVSNIMTFQRKISSGFTIIELLVVVAIIAVLTGIVLVNVTAYITRGRDSAAKGNLATMLTNGAVYFDANSAFNAAAAANNWINIAATSVAVNTPGGCVGNAGFVGPCQALVGPTTGNGGSAGASYPLTFACSSGAVGAATSIVCNVVTGTSTITNWCANITLKGTGTPTYCVDATGTKRVGALCNTSGVNTGFCS